MALPAINSAWPPFRWKRVYWDMKCWAAWYSGDPLRLAAFYQKSLDNPFDPLSSLYGQLSAEERKLTLHVPIAGDLSSTSASLLFGDHPSIKVVGAGEVTDAGQPVNPDADKTQDRLDTLIKEANIYSRILEAAELQSPFGGVFLKINWDTNQANYPILSVGRADCALPTFWNGILTECIFWTELAHDDGGEIYWHMEYHTPGKIENALYVGGPDPSTIGSKVPLTDHEQTASLPEVINTGLDRLACVYIPNNLPNRHFDPVVHPAAMQYMGQSHYSSSEGLMESLDQAYTSLMRDIELGQGRIIGPMEYMRPVTDDQGKVKMQFDMNRKVYMGLDMNPDAEAPLTCSQFAIRAEEHLRIAVQLFTDIVTNAGYSPQTFGMQIHGRAESGTALNMRENKSMNTTAKKAEYWRSPLEEILYKLMVIDSTHFSQSYTPMPVTVSIQESVKPDILQRSQAVLQIAQAEAATTRTKVRMLNPDWSDRQVAEEAEGILKERGMMVQSPDQLMNEGFKQSGD